MAKKILVYINEELGQMQLGRSSTLSYIVAAIQKNHEVFVHNLPIHGKIISDNIEDEIEVVHLNKKNCANLDTKYQQENAKLKSLIDSDKKESEKLEQLINLPKIKLNEVVKIFSKEKLKLSEAQFVIQRLEPMKTPFPPEGAENIDEILSKMKNLFPPYFVFNCPLNKRDKELPLILEKEYKSLNSKSLSTPTSESFIDDNNIAREIVVQTNIYQSLFKNDKKKIVLKPDNSAQASGVYALEFDKNGLNLNEIKQKKIKELSEIQLYNIKDNLPDDEIKKIVNLLCFIQSYNAKTIKIFSAEQRIDEIGEDDILKFVRDLYNNKILIQPFLEGVKFGDIRVNIAKNKKGDFVVVGSTLRRSITKEDSRQFTTCLTAGQSVLQPIDVLCQENILGQQKGEETIADLIKKVQFILERLNNSPLKEDYDRCTEMGLDFILTGDAQTVMLGEVNHHCPAVIPQAEATMGNFISVSDFYRKVNAQLPLAYSGGIGITSKIIEDQIFFQEERSKN